MKSIAALQEMTGEALKEWNPGTGPRGLYEPIQYILALGGKRLRPVLTLAACDLAGGDPSRALGPALGIELFHNFTLMHDDIMDQAPLRRNQPAVHEKWSVSTAILSGDAMLVKAYEKIMECDESILRQVLTFFNETAISVCEGQQLDMDFETRDQVRLTEYMEMITLKTATLVAASLGIGAMIGGAGREDVECLYAYGKHTGIAFQLMDDWLDVFGEPERFGKQRGGDILSNKKTFLLLTAWEKSGKKQRNELQRWMAVSDRPEEKVAGVRQIFEDLQVDRQSRLTMEEHYNLARQYMSRVSVPEERKAPLLAFMDGLMHRSV